MAKVMAILDDNTAKWTAWAMATHEIKLQTCVSYEPWQAT